jgi:hypothetical protein
MECLVDCEFRPDGSRRPTGDRYKPCLKFLSSLFQASIANLDEWSCDIDHRGIPRPLMELGRSARVTSLRPIVSNPLLTLSENGDERTLQYSYVRTVRPRAFRADVLAALAQQRAPERRFRVLRGSKIGRPRRRLRQTSRPTATEACAFSRETLRRAESACVRFRQQIGRRLRARGSHRRRAARH